MRADHEDHRSHHHHACEYRPNWTFGDSTAKLAIHAGMPDGKRGGHGRGSPQRWPGHMDSSTAHHGSQKDAGGHPTASAIQFLAELVKPPGSGLHWYAFQVTRQIGAEQRCGTIPLPGILAQRFQKDAIEIAGKLLAQTAD